MKELTQEEKRAKIAEHLGWKWVQFEGARDPFLEHPDKLCTSYTGPRLPEPISSPRPAREDWTMDRTLTEWGVPDFFNDLNACREMARTLPKEAWNAYVNRLDEQIEAEDQPERDFLWCTASAEQHCEAFAATLGLW